MEERRERLPPNARTKLKIIASVFDIVRILIGGIFFAIGLLIWAVSTFTIIGAAVGWPLGLVSAFFGSTFSFIVSSIATMTLGWLYHSYNISLVDQSGSKFVYRVLLQFFSIIPLIPWAYISVALVIRAVEKEDREYNESRGL